MCAYASQVGKREKGKRTIGRRFIAKVKAGMQREGLAEMQVIKYVAAYSKWTDQDSLGHSETVVGGLLICASANAHA